VVESVRVARPLDPVLTHLVDAESTRAPRSLVNEGVTVL
jgi:hypothetical protein